MLKESYELRLVIDVWKVWHGVVIDSFYQGEITFHSNFRYKERDLCNLVTSDFSSPLSFVFLTWSRTLSCILTKPSCSLHFWVWRSRLLETMMTIQLSRQTPLADPSLWIKVSQTDPCSSTMCWYRYLLTSSWPRSLQSRNPSLLLRQIHQDLHAFHLRRVPR